MDQCTRKCINVENSYNINGQCIEKRFPMKGPVKCQSGCILDSDCSQDKYAQKCVNLNYFFFIFQDYFLKI